MPELPTNLPVRQRLLSLLRPSRGQIAWAVALCLVAMAVVMQIQSTRAGDRYAGMRRDDLVSLLDGLTQETDRLQAEIAELERTRDALQSGADASEISWFMPIFLTFICLSLPGGVLLYWGVSSLLGVIHQLRVIRRTNQEMQEKPALFQEKPTRKSEA